MRNPLSRLACRDHAKPTLRQRADALKATATRVMRPKGPALSPLPAPGSEVAKAMFRAACEEHSRMAHDDLQNVDPRLQREGLQPWSTDTLSLALEDRDITPAEFAVLYPLAQAREHRLDAAAIATNVVALHALAFAEDFKGEPASTDAAAAPATTLMSAPRECAASRIGKQMETLQAEIIAMDEQRAWSGTAEQRAAWTQAEDRYDLLIAAISYTRAASPGGMLAQLAATYAAFDTAANGSDERDRSEGFQQGVRCLHSVAAALCAQTGIDRSGYGADRHLPLYLDKLASLSPEAA